MADYSVIKLDEVADILGDYPGEMKLLKSPLGCEQVAVSYRRMPKHTGAKGSYGHRHKTQEEIIFVFKGELQVKVGDDIVELGPLSAIRIAPGVTQGLWNDKDEDVELLIISNRIEPEDEVDTDPDFWPAK